MMRRAFETVAMDRLRRIGEACLLCSDSGLGLTSFPLHGASL